MPKVLLSLTLGLQKLIQSRTTNLGEPHQKEVEERTTRYTLTLLSCSLIQTIAVSPKNASDLTSSPQSEYLDPNTTKKEKNISIVLQFILFLNIPILKETG